MATAAETAWMVVGASRPRIPIASVSANDCRRLYGWHLGMIEVAPPEDRRGKEIWLRAGDVDLVLEMNDEPSRQRSDAGETVIMVVDLMRAARRLEEAGQSFRWVEQSQERPCLRLHDPSGNLLELRQPRLQ